MVVGAIKEIKADVRKRIKIYQWCKQKHRVSSIYGSWYIYIANRSRPTDCNKPQMWLWLAPASHGGICGSSQPSGYVQTWLGLLKYRQPTFCTAKKNMTLRKPMTSDIEDCWKHDLHQTLNSADNCPGPQKLILKEKTTLHQHPTPVQITKLSEDNEFLHKLSPTWSEKDIFLWDVF